MTLTLKKKNIPKKVMNCEKITNFAIEFAGLDRIKEVAIIEKSSE